MEGIIRWVRTVALAAFSLTRQAVFSLRDYWGVAILSVILATALWIYVTDQDNPETTGRVTGTVPIEAVNLPTNQAVFSISHNGVSVRVRAPENVLNDLRPENFEATIDLVDVTAQQVTVDVDVVADNTRVEVVEVTPAQVVVRLENVTSRTVPIETSLVGAPPRGFEAREISIEPPEAVVTGPESLVERVAVVEGDLNLNGVRASLQETLLLAARDERGGSIQGVSVEPDAAQVSVDIVQLEFSRVLVVLPEITGTPATGFAATSFEIEPSFVVVTGPPEVFQILDPLTGVRTEPVSIDGASADVVRPVPLQLPEGAIVEEPSVTVRVIIQPVELRAAAWTGVRW